jgi:predicted TIM-barrel fold metal-dependent hydrolase
MKIIPFVFSIFLFQMAAKAQKKKEPIIDMHIHANHANFAGKVPMTLCIYNDQYPVSQTGVDWTDSLEAATNRCKHRLISPTTDDEVMNQTLAIFKKRNIIGVTNGRLTEKWQAAAPARIIPSLIYRADGTDPTADSMRKIFAKGNYKVFGEIHAQYEGISADDVSLDPYWAMAEELNLPVGIHIGPGPIGAPYFAWKKYRAGLHSPLQLEAVLSKYPRLKVYIMHAAWPMIDELLALLWTHPQVHVDISGIVTDLNRTAFYSYLKKIVEAGFCNRIMFGSDSMIWPQLVEESLKTIETAPFLSKSQIRDILYNNAARFLNLSKEEIARHHNMDQ